MAVLDASRTPSADNVSSGMSYVSKGVTEVNRKEVVRCVYVRSYTQESPAEYQAGEALGLNRQLDGLRLGHFYHGVFFRT